MLSIRNLCRGRCALFLFCAWLVLVPCRFGNGLATTNDSASSRKSKYYSYKAFKRMGVPALVYSVVSNAVASLLKLEPKKIPPTTTTEEGNRRRVAVVTGSNTGVGFDTAKTLVQDHGFEVVIACRSKEKGLQACSEINSYSSSSSNHSSGKAVFVQTLDLADLESVRAFCGILNERYDTIDVLVNNAGRNSAGTTTPSAGSLDLVFKINFLGHFLLTNQLLDKCQRIVNLASVMHHFPKDSKKDYDGKSDLMSSAEYWRDIAVTPAGDGETERKTYAPSKMAALLFSIELNRRYAKTKGIRSIAVNPGSVNSDIWRNYSDSKKALFRRIYLTPEQGCCTSVAASVLDLDEDAIYLQPYLLPFQRQKSPPYPLFEMLGPFVGYRVTQPRLPHDDGLQACESLFAVCEELSKCKFSPQ